MDEQRDPMALWVGIWTPEDVIDRETRVLTRRDQSEHSGDQSVRSEPNQQ